MLVYIKLLKYKQIFKNTFLVLDVLILKILYVSASAEIKFLSMIVNSSKFLEKQIYKRKPKK